jgi:hypothetical protein
VDHQLGVRLRTLKGRDPGRFTVSTVLALTEAAGLSASNLSWHR